jgi:hypothetical protein
MRIAHTKAEEKQEEKKKEKTSRKANVTKTKFEVSP